MSDDKLGYVIIELTDEAEGCVWNGVRIPPGTQRYWPGDEPIPLGWKQVSSLQQFDGENA